jgi:hypothetical protein
MKVAFVHIYAPLPLFYIKLKPNFTGFLKNEHITQNIGTIRVFEAFIIYFPVSCLNI